jgi:hypothetical protein
VRHTYTSTREKRIDFWAGFAGWIVINAALIAVITQLGSTAGPIAAGLLILANIAVPIVLAFTRGFTALGILVAFAAALALTVISGVFSTVGDFISAASGYHGTGTPTAVIVALIIGGIVWLIAAFFALRAINRGIR